jgi:hypothetical protein
MYAKMWKQLSEKDEQKFREYARQTYAPGSDINEVWHPITHTLLKEVLVKLKCKPAFTPENIVILNEYDALLTKREQLQNDIDIVKTRLHLKVDYTDPRVT